MPGTSAAPATAGPGTMSTAMARHDCSARGTAGARLRRRAAIALAALALAWPPASALGTGERALIEALQGGGYVIYFRHAQTDWSQHDDVRGPGDWTSCDPERMRQLSREGRETARAVGAAMRRLDIPVDAVHASEYCRCVQTAALLDVGPVRTTRDILNARAAEYVGGREALARSARRRLATPPPGGSNTVLVAHGNVFLMVAGARPPEGGAAVVRPEGDGRFTLVGILPAATWIATAADAAPQ